MKKQLQVRNETPAIWPLVKWAFPTADLTKHPMTWGDTVYADLALSRDTLEHERIHAEQQHYSKVIGFFSILLYIFSMKYRKKCEVEAYMHQHYLLGRDPLATYKIAKWMSDPIYGPMLTYEEAVKLLSYDKKTIR